MMKTKLLLVLLVAVGLMAPTARANLLSNPSFEDGFFKEKNVPDNWSMSWSESTSAWTWFDDADAAHWGDKYIKKVSFIAYGSSAWMWQTVDVTPDQEYAFSVWAKCPVEGEQSEVWGHYEWLDSASEVIGWGWLPYSDMVEDNWEHADFGTKTAPESATRVMFSLVGVPENGPMGVLLDDAHMGIPLPSFPSPAWETAVLIGDVDLSWTNLDSNDPNIPVYVEVLFGTEPFGAEPNEPDPAYDMELLTLDPVSGQDVTSVTVNVPDMGTYYWQVKSYLDGDPATTSYDTNDPNDPNSIKGHMWSFTTTDDLPPSVTINNPAMIAWQNEPVQLDVTVIDEGKTPMLIEWTAPATGVTFEPNEFVEDPVVTIIKGTNPNARVLNPSFELRLAYWDRIGEGHGAWTGSYDGVKYINPSDGALLAYTDSASNGGADAGLAQIMIETFTADTTYTLTVDVANDGHYDEDVDYRVQLLAGGAVLAEDNNEQHELPIPTGSVKWETSTVKYVYDEVADANKLGEPLEIRLLAIDGTREMSFDNVHLTANPGFLIPPGTPYTLTVTATDAAGSNSDTMTIDMYDDACQAARVGLYLGAANRGDIVSHSDSRPDCVTDLYDLAEMALKWLKDTLPTEAFVDPVQPPVDPVVNGIFDCYKPGSETITAEFIYDSYTAGVGEDLPVLNSGIVIYSDGTSGGVVDCPGWVQIEGTCPPDLLNNGVGSSVGFNAFGEWSGERGTMAVSDRPVGVISGGKIYTISAMVNGSAGPLVLKLQADGVTLTPSFSVTPGSTDGWEKLSRTYDAGAVADHLGKPMKILIGTTPPGLFGTRVIFDNVELEIVSSDPRLPDVDAGVDMVTWSDQAVQLAPTVVNNDPNDPQGTLTYAWSTSGEPNDIVFSDPNTLAPTVTITKEPAIPAIVPFVANSGFEDPILADGDWTYTPTGWLEGWYDLADGGPDWPAYEWGAGVTNPDAGYGYGGTAPEGENVAFATSDPGYDGGLTQILQYALLQPGSTYELSALVGNPSPYNLATNGSTATADYRIELLAGGVVIASTNDKGLGEGDPSPADDTYWTTASLTFTTGGSHPQLGRPLEIRLIAVDFANGYEVNFDDVQLLINGESEEIVYSHLPTVVKLTLGVTLEGYVTVFDTMAIDVYDTPCLALIETYPDSLDPTDITADDCITNLVDFAVMAETWLDDYTLTEPAPKPAAE